MGLCAGFDGRACAVERADDGSQAVAVSGMDRLGECFISEAQRIQGAWSPPDFFWG